MSRYLAKIIIPSVFQTQTVRGYLSRGRIVRIENATRYCHPSAAKAALDAYAKRHQHRSLTLQVVDTRL